MFRPTVLGLAEHEVLFSTETRSRSTMVLFPGPNRRVERPGVRTKHETEDKSYLSIISILHRVICIALPLNGLQYAPMKKEADFNGADVVPISWTSGIEEGRGLGSVYGTTPTSLRVWADMALVCVQAAEVRMRIL